jgi:hypothetical protein
MESRQAIFSRQKAAESGGAGGEAAEHDPPMGNAFVWRNRDFGVDERRAAR